MIVGKGSVSTPFGFPSLCGLFYTMIFFSVDGKVY